MSDPGLQDVLDQGARELRLALDAETRRKLLGYVELLAKWNQAYNLTAVRDPRQMVVRHILDSLAVVPFLPGERLLDVGTGPGLPGLPLAMARPRLRVTLLDANAKKIRFVRQAVAELALDNVQVVQSRMQEYQPGRAFDMVISRAVASLDELYRQSHHLLSAGGRMLFMKGTLPEAEMKAFPAGAVQLQYRQLLIPGLEAQRHLLWLDNKG